MKNYAKFCKLNIDNKNYLLNLTEGGFDTAGWLGRSFSTIRLAAPIYSIFVIVKNLVTFLTLGTINLMEIPYLMTSTILTLGFCIPHTSLGNAFNYITKSFILKLKTKKYYKKMRKLELVKYDKPSFSKTINLKQTKTTQKFIKILKKYTYKFENRTSNYYKKEKRGKLSALNNFALENMEMHQEAIDKFIFHNYGLLIKLVPNEKEFLDNRLEKWYNTIKNNKAYYDEFIYSATHEENLVKNDCIKLFDTTNYFERLQKMFNLKMEGEIPYYSLSSLKDNTSKLSIDENLQTKTIQPSIIDIFEKI